MCGEITNLAISGLYLINYDACMDAQPELALVARLLLIHDYRRLVLRDPLVPGALLPVAWPGNTARALCAGLYLALLPGSERWMDAHGLNETGPLPAPGRAIGARFRHSRVAEV